MRGGPDPQAAWQLWCDTRVDLFRNHPQSPIHPAERDGYAGPHVYAYDPSLRLTVALASTSNERLDLPAGDDGVVRLRAAARTVGLQPHLGGELTLYWMGGYGGGMFLPFADATSGRETYGAGRYLLDTIKGADLGFAGARVVLDFNFAYFPSCAYSPRYLCPLAPRGNRLPLPVASGERHARRLSA